MKKDLLGEIMPDEVTDKIQSVWESLDDEQMRQDQSHWRGVGRWSDDERWLGIGRRSAERIALICSCLNKPPSVNTNPPVMLEWGPGGGANLVAFKHHAKRYYGVDISEKNLREAQRVVGEAGYPDVFVPVLLSGPPETVLGMIDEPVDIFLSTAVFQHFPSKEYGAEVLSVIHRLSRRNAIGFIQIRFDNLDPEYRPIDDIGQYKDRFITANSYRIEEFYDMCTQTGFRVLFLREINTEVNYATYYLAKA
jgi:hypothetical protein